MPLQSLSTLADALDSKKPSHSPAKEEKIHRNGDDASANVATGPQLKRARVGPSRNSLPGTDASDSEVDDEKDDVTATVQQLPVPGAPHNVKTQSQRRQPHLQTPPLG